MQNLKFDRFKYEAVMLNGESAQTYAFAKDNHPDLKEAGDDALYICHPVGDDGDLLYQVHIILRKEEFLLIEQ